MEQTIMVFLKPIIYAVLAAVAGITGFYIKKLGTVAVNYLKSKLGENVSSQAYEMAKGLYIYLEDKYGEDVRKMGAVKKAEMEEMLLKRFPTLTQEELDSINKTVWLSFQEGFDGTYPSNSLKALPTSTRIDG